MGCPKCKSLALMTGTVKTESKIIESVAFWRVEKTSLEKKDFFRCLDCGHEWELRPEKSTTERAVW